MKDPLIGQVIDGYHIEQLLGQGGMANVYRALDLKLERPIALKIISPQMREPDDYQQRFDREARSVASLKHPNIVGVYRYNDVNGLFFMAMEFVDGADLGWVLRDYRKQNQLMDYASLRQFMQEMTSALDYAHTQGVIHRDIKPSNIMINREGHAVLTDFGLALLASEGTTGRVFGTPHYISPEQAMNSAKVVPASDFYSLAVVLYELLTGHIPFSQGTPLEIAKAHLDETLPDPMQLQQWLHGDFAAVLNKALAKKPEDRYENGAAFYAALDAAIITAEASSQSALPPPAPKPAERIRLRVAPSAKPVLPSLFVADPAQAASANSQRERGPATILAAMLIVALLIASAALFLLLVNDRQVGTTAIPTSDSAVIVTDDETIVTARIVGVITDFDRDRVVMVYDLPLIFTGDEEILNDVEVGATLEFEGQYSLTDDGSLVILNITTINIRAPRSS